MIGPFDFATELGLHFDLVRAQDSKNEALERLSTGKRINRASDDPSGLIAAENIRADIARLEGSIKRDEREITRLGALDGALGVLSDLFIELNAIVVTAANSAGLSDAEKQALQSEADSILDAIDLTNDTARFGGQRVLGSYGTRQLGAFIVAESEETPEGGDDEAGGGDPVEDDATGDRRIRDLQLPEPVAIGGDFFRLADLRSGGRLNLVDGDPELAQRVVEGGRDRVVGSRAAAGARIKEVESDLRTKRETLINQSGALSVIEDADFAAEAAKLVRSQLLEQASLSAIVIGRQSTESVLALLQPANGFSRPAPLAAIG